ncbi:tripartite tricarboxylate transporter substrate binding protein [Diaphorobacter sp.]|uniref:Bug family tripartite tricarboxylate transporter substrate binding protein n=1 Tax=Diaphorobacter sp. TaxID=1934310 RepID=UPI0028AF8D98|nr:tripartite tricarboxylate transporter substrate binding protein [Diaphorobacter sp.]
MSAFQLLCRTFIFSLTFLAASTALAANWPNGPVRIVVPFSPGGSTDIIGRMLAKKLAPAIGQSVFVENISGGGSIVGMQAVANGASDGNSMVLTGTGSLTVMRHTNRKMPIDPFTALTPVTMVNTLPHWLVVRSDRPEKTFGEFLDYIKKNPGKVSISVNAFGGAAHLALAKWAKDNNLDITIVPYRGSSAAMLDLVGGSTTAHVDVVGSTMSFANSGKVTPLALLQETPLVDYPKFPVTPPRDKGGLIVRGDHVLAVKSGTSPAIVNRINEEVRKAIFDSEFLELLKGFGYEPLSMTPAEAKKLLERDSDRYKEIVRATNITID